MLHFDMLVQRFTIVRNGCRCYRESLRYGNFTGLRRETERHGGGGIVLTKTEKDEQNCEEIARDQNIAVDFRFEVTS
jgi:hypothetical protein